MVIVETISLPSFPLPSSLLITGEARGGWSSVPGQRLRNLRGGVEADASKPLMIGPGMYLMPEGVKDLSEVKALAAHSGNATVMAAEMSEMETEEVAEGGN